MNTLLKWVRVLYAVWLAFRKWRASRRTAAVRADPAGEWLRKFGGTDTRSASGTDDAGRDDNG